MTTNREKESIVNTTDRKGVPAFVSKPVFAGIHSDNNCGGRLFMIMDNPFGRWKCEKCGMNVSGRGLPKISLGNWPKRKKGGEKNE